MPYRKLNGHFVAGHRASRLRFDRCGFATVRGIFPGQSDAKKATGVKAADAADAYEHLLTIQNAADLELPAINPANAPQRAEFRLGIFPPDHHAAPAPTLTPTPVTTPTK